MLTGLRKKKWKLPSKIYWREALAVLLLLIGIHFFRQERRELVSIVPYLEQAQPFWLLAGLLVTALCIFFQSGMYVSSFAAVQTRITGFSALELFLKRNLLSVFLPGGGVSALAYVPGRVNRAVTEKVKIHQASGLFAFAGMLSVFIVGLPVLVFSGSGEHFRRSVPGLLLLTVLLILVMIAVRSLRRKGWLYRFIDRKFPRLAAQMHEMADARYERKRLLRTIWFSVGVEFCGILHLYIAMRAMGLPASLQAAGLAYIISVLLMVVSPFLKGMGAVEFSIVFVLGWFGYTPLEALAIAILYRVFEFWLLLLAGLFAFMLKGKHIFLRLFPAALIFVLGIVNILSILHPPAGDRMRVLRDLLPVASIHASHALVVFLGIALLVTAAFLIRGLRTAWWIALVFSFLSILGNMARAPDHEKAVIAAVVFLSLVSTARYYRGKSNPRLVNTGLSVALITFGVVLIYGFVGFYFLEKRHFGIDFTWDQSAIRTIRSFLLLQTDDLHPRTVYGREFIGSIHLLGLLAWGFLLFALIKPYFRHIVPQESVRERARFMLEQYGNSASDYFKVDEDKLIFLSDLYDGFVSYKVAGGFVIVLEEPVCAEEDKVPLLGEFERQCKRMGLKTAFYRVDETSICYFNQLKKKKMLIGQEAVVEVGLFSLKGKAQKSLRNALNSLKAKGFDAAFYEAPHTDELIGQLKTVSDEWLRHFHKKEMVFSQGMFHAEELKMQDLIVVRNAGGNIVAFLNIIPDFAPGECTYDLIRKTAASPPGCMDALIIELIDYAARKGLQYVNLGLVPMAGIEDPESTAEQLVKYAYEKIRRFRHFQGLREFKEKYASRWLNKYLLYDNDFDLLQLPAALNKVMQPR